MKNPKNKTVGLFVVYARYQDICVVSRQKPQYVGNCHFALEAFEITIDMFGLP